MMWMRRLRNSLATKIEDSIEFYKKLSDAQKQKFNELARDYIIKEFNKMLKNAES